MEDNEYKWITIPQLWISNLLVDPPAYDTKFKTKGYIHQELRRLKISDKPDRTLLCIELTQRFRNLPPAVRNVLRNAIDTRTPVVVQGRYATKPGSIITPVKLTVDSVSILSGGLEVVEGLEGALTEYQGGGLEIPDET